jgi:hypothetical protein
MALAAADRLSDRICEPVQKLTRADCQAWIRQCGVILSKVQAKRYEPVRRQEGYSGSYSVAAMLTKKNKVCSSQRKYEVLDLLPCQRLYNMIKRCWHKMKVG